MHVRSLVCFNLLTPALEEPLPRAFDAAYEVFYGEEAEGLWVRLRAEIPMLAAQGVRVLMLPPIGKGAAGLASHGYDAHDYHDFGGLPQNGTVGTRWGSEEELRLLVADAREADMHVVCDLPLTKLFAGTAAPMSRIFKHPPDTVSEVPGQPGCQHLLLRHPHNRREALGLLTAYTQLGITGVRWCSSDLVPPELVNECLESLPLLRISVAWPRWDMPGQGSSLVTPTVKVAGEGEAEDGLCDEDRLQQWVDAAPDSLYMDFTFWRQLLDTLAQPTGSAWFDLLSRDVSRSVLFVRSHAVHHALSLSVPHALLGYTYILCLGRGLPLVSSHDMVPGVVCSLVQRLLSLCRASPGRARVLHCDDTVLALCRRAFCVVLNPGATSRVLGLALPGWRKLQRADYVNGEACDVQEEEASEGCLRVDVPPRSVCLWWEVAAPRPA